MTIRRLAALAALPLASLALALTPTAAFADAGTADQYPEKKWVCVSYPGYADADVVINAGQLLGLGVDAYAYVHMTDGVYCGWVEVWEE